MVKSYFTEKSTAEALSLGHAAGVPNLIFMTDEERVPDPADICLGVARWQYCYLP